MGWLGWFGLAVLVTGFAAVTGMRPKGGRPVAGTQLMGVARVVLWALVIVLLYLGYRAYSAG